MIWKIQYSHTYPIQPKLLLWNFRSGANHVKKMLTDALTDKNNVDHKMLERLIKLQPRIEKVAIKDAKPRTFITEDSSRDDLVAHVYDVTYGGKNRQTTWSSLMTVLSAGPPLKKAS